MSMSYRFRLLLTVALLAPTAMLGAGCQASWPPWDSPSKGGVYLVEIGRSPSTRSAADAVEANLGAVIDRADADGARLKVNPIGERAAGAKPVNVDFKPRGAATSNHHEADKQHAGDKRKAEADISKLLGAPAARYSNDTLAALADAGSQLQLLGDAGAKHLIVIDDLRQMGSGCDFYRDRLTPSYIRSTLRRIAPEIPDLTGVSVTFTGAGVTHKGRAFNWRREHQIEAFWRAWAAAAHAKNVTYTVSMQS